MNRDKAVELAKKLANFNKDNATQAEVELAAQHLQRIMNEHQLSQLDLMAEEAEGRVGEDRQGFEYKRPPYWLKWFLGEVGAIFRVKVILHDNQMVTFIGDDTDIALAKYFTASVLNLPRYNMMIRDWNRARKAGMSTKGYIPAWDLAFATAITKRLRDEYDQWYRDLDAERQSKVRTLILVKGDALKKYVERHFPSLRKTRMTHPKDHAAAREAGYAAGMNAKINKGMRGSATPQPKLEG